MIKISPQHRLGGYEKTFSGTKLKEEINLNLMSIAAPNADPKPVSKLMQKALKLSWPEIGTTNSSAKPKISFLGLQNDMIFAAFNSASDADKLAKIFNGKAYMTNQSDAWIGLSLSGPLARAALERISQLDLHPDSFAQGAVARTAMEHLGVIIWRTGKDAFTLISATSSAESFLHAIEESLDNVS